MNCSICTGALVPFHCVHITLIVIAQCFTRPSQTWNLHTSRHLRCWNYITCLRKMDNYQFNWFFVFSIICLSVADKHYDDTQDQVYRRQGSSRVRIPKFEFYIYNDIGTMVKQYLTVREIQQLLLQQSLRLGPPLWLIIKVKSVNFLLQEWLRLVCSWGEILLGGRHHNLQSQRSPSQKLQYHYQRSKTRVMSTAPRFGVLSTGKAIVKYFSLLLTLFKNVI